MSKSVLSEAMIQASILDYLAARHIFSLRMNSGTQVVNDNGHRRAIHMHEPRTSDQGQVEDEGHRYIIARSIEDVEEALR